jgi:3-oxoacyl-[acyl-carrier protein] reductase
MLANELDITADGATEEAFDCAERHFGAVDILVNNACADGLDTLLPLEAAQPDKVNRPQETISRASFERQFMVNTRAPALLMAEFVRRHLARPAGWGRIVNISTDGAAGFPQEVSYWASKAALESYSRAAARELAAHGITVNIVSPGPIQTGWFPEKMEPEMARNIPLGRVGQPEDIADAVVFLVSEQARWITGQLLRVNGGHVMM